MTVQDLLINWLVPVFAIAAALVGLWKIMADRQHVIEERIGSIERNASAAAQATRLAAEMQIRDLEKQLHSFQLETAKTYCSVTTIAQMEDRFSGQFKSLFENMESVRERVDALFDKFIEKSVK